MLSIVDLVKQDMNQGPPKIHGRSSQKVPFMMSTWTSSIMPLDFRLLCLVYWDLGRGSCSDLSEAATILSISPSSYWRFTSVSETAGREKNPPLCTRYYLSYTFLAQHCS